MRYPFQVLPGESKPRPVVSFAFANRPRTRLLGLVDSGAHGTRIGREWADELDIDLSGIDAQPFLIGGRLLSARKAPVTLMVDRHRFATEVSFVDNWTFPHNVLGLEGFFDRFVVRIDAADQELKLAPKRHLPRTG
jgi:hypothetical protein